MQTVAEKTYTAEPEESSALLEATAALRPVIRSYLEETERERRIPKPLVEQLHAAGLYRMLRPRELGGLQVDLLTFFRALELAAEGDGCVGWNLAINAVGSIMGGISLPDDGVEEVFARGPEVTFAGTIGPRGGRAVAVDGGYLATGRWRFGSGSQEADWLVGSCEVIDGDQPRRHPDGTPVFRRAVFPVADCTILDTWDVTGMRGTGSHDWMVADVFVPERRTVEFRASMFWANTWDRWPGTLYALPAHTFLGPGLSAVATGIARAGIDALTELAGSKTPRTQTGLLREQAQVQDWVARAEALLGSAQAYRTAVTTDIWQTVADGRPATQDQTARCRLAATYAVENAVQAMDLMWRAGGTTSIEQNHLLARCWRDVHVVGQHGAVHPEFFPMSGRLFLGLDPGPRLA